MWDAETGMIDTWHKYCQKQMKDQFHMLDEKLIFSNTKVTKRDYASKSLPYPLEPGETPAWERLVSTLYSPEERHKIEWCIGLSLPGSPRSCKVSGLLRSGGHRKEHHHQCDHAALRGYHTSFSAKDLAPPATPLLWRPSAPIRWWPFSMTATSPASRQHPHQFAGVPRDDDCQRKVPLRLLQPL